MKSLEIVYKILMEATQYASGTDDEYKRFISFTTLTDDIETIQQDLEVLEILRKHLEIVEYLGMKDIETSGLNTIKNIKDFNIVKQWLEKNER